MIASPWEEALFGDDELAWRRVGGLVMPSRNGCIDIIAGAANIIRRNVRLSTAPDNFACRQCIYFSRVNPYKIFIY